MQDSLSWLLISRISSASWTNKFLQANENDCYSASASYMDGDCKVFLDVPSLHLSDSVPHLPLVEIEIQLLDKKRRNHGQLV